MNRAWNIADFGHKGFGKQVTHPSQFLRNEFSQDIGKVMSCLKLKLEIYEMIFFCIVLAFKIL